MSAGVANPAGALRELHWHPNADEWQYVIEGDVNVTMFGSHGRFRNEPDRRNTAATRSGYRAVITSDQMPPPECPHRAQGIVASSGCFACADNSPRALINVLPEPRRGSNPSPGQLAISKRNSQIQLRTLLWNIKASPLFR